MQKNSFVKFCTHKLTLLLLAIIMAFVSFMFYSCRANYVFLDIYVFDGFSYLLLALMIVVTLLLLALYVINTYCLSSKKTRIKDTKTFAVLSVLGLLATVILFIGVCLNLIIAGEETLPVIAKMAKNKFPIFICFFAIVFLLAVFPAIKHKTLKITITAVVGVAILISSLYVLAPVCIYKITSDPLVIDSGEDYYSVVFCTNDQGTGYVEYTYNDTLIRLYDEAMGRIKGDSTIHTIKVPKTHLVNNSYRVGSTRVIEAYSYGSNLGKEVVSEYYDFKTPTGDKQTWLSVSDWHTRLDKAYDAISYAGDYNGVIMLGDAVPGLMFEDEIKDNIVEFGGNISKGTMPVIFVRGNHETRGEYAQKLPDYLGIENFYYTTSYGEYEFIVLDSGEDKDDSHPEYGGMVNYNQYRQKMTNWLENLTTDKINVIALSHSYEICIEDDLSQRCYTALKNIGVANIISGHSHTNELFDHNDMNIYLDGGHNNNKFIASKLTLENGKIILQAYENLGTLVFDNSININR